MQYIELRTLVCILLRILLHYDVNIMIVMHSERERERKRAKVHNIIINEKKKTVFRILYITSARSIELRISVGIIYRKELLLK